MAAAAGIIDTRTVGRLEIFDGTSQSWPDWVFRAHGWFCLLNAGQAMTDTAGDPIGSPQLLDGARGSVIPTAPLASQQGFSEVVYHVLVQVCRSKAQGILRSAPRLNGLESWRLLHRESESATGTRLNALLCGILNPTCSSTIADTEERWCRSSSVCCGGCPCRHIEQFRLVRRRRVYASRQTQHGRRASGSEKSC